LSYPKYRAAGIIVGADWDALVRTVLNYGGATAIVGTNANLVGRENYFRCTGVADEVQINLAIVYVNALGGGSVCIQQGNYTLAANIVLLANVFLFGAGVDTVLTIPAATDDCIEVNAVTGWKIAFMTLRTTGAGANDAVSLVNADDGEIFSVVIDDSGQDGIAIDAATADVNIHDNKISNCTRYGINNIGDDIQIMGNRIDTTGNDGIWIQAAAANTIVSLNRISNWTGEAIDDDSGTTEVAHNISV